VVCVCGGCVGGGLASRWGVSVWSQNMCSCCSGITSYRIRTFLNSPLASDRAASVADTALWNSEAMTRASLVYLQSYADFSGTQFDSSIRKKGDGNIRDAKFTLRTNLTSLARSDPATPPGAKPLTGCHPYRELGQAVGLRICHSAAINSAGAKEGH
jgi:hypothetical protein